MFTEMQYGHPHKCSDCGKIFFCMQSRCAPGAGVRRKHWCAGCAKIVANG